jgi:hypothetical protein
MGARESRRSKVASLKQFLLFTASTLVARKAYVASFDSREAAIQAGESLKGDAVARWQVIDNATSTVTAEDPGLIARSTED